jgi:hypothetical protein
MAVAFILVELAKFVNLLEHPGYVSTASKDLTMQFMV